MTRLLSESLKDRTRSLHTQVERSAFMHDLLRGRMDRHGYCLLLRNLHDVYAALEPALERHSGHPLLAPLHLVGLARKTPLQRDLESLEGAHWRESLPLESVTSHYVTRLQTLAERDPALLVAHSYVRYLGDLSGGQMLARIVRDSIAPSVLGGTAFYDFGDAQATERLRHDYRAGLDALATDEATSEAIVNEAVLSFELHGQLFEALTRARISR
ncbi:MAG: biliverdin-producing heme oxygenase [Comamonadaceae bacterium]|nr:MAG: biliverdin-producing heme oxygenase [Comamonadaceae bacterium]